MIRPLLLASASEIRLRLLQNAGLQVTAQPARVDEESIRAALESEGAKPRDIADALAEAKSRKLADKNPTSLVLGCDQVLVLNGKIYAKAESPVEARAHLHQLRGQTHQLISAIVLYDQAKPIWRHVSEARLTMRPVSDAYLDDYIAWNWQSARHSVGVYKLEEEGLRLFSKIDGDYFTILGLPMLPLISYLGTRGFIPT